MSVSKDKKTGKWKSTFYYTDWTGKKVKKIKRGFATKSEALDWENHFRLEKASNLDMTFLLYGILLNYNKIFFVKKSCIKNVSWYNND